MRVHAGYLSSGDLVSFSYYCLEVGGAIDKLVACVGAIQAAVGASARVVELLDSPVEFADDAVATCSSSISLGWSLAEMNAKEGIGNMVDHDLETGIEMGGRSTHNSPNDASSGGNAFAMSPGGNGRMVSLSFDDTPDAVAMEFVGVSFRHAGSSSSNNKSNVSDESTSNGRRTNGNSQRVGLLEDFSGRDEFESISNGDELSSSLHKNWGLHDVSFAVRRGEVVALVGPSGAGKSTLLDLAARFYDPDRGDVKVMIEKGIEVWLYYFSQSLSQRYQLSLLISTFFVRHIGCSSKC